MASETTQDARELVSAGRKNLLINGDFKIWQRGTSFTSSSVNEYSADRFRTEGFPLNSVISQQAFTSGQTEVPGFPSYYCRVTTSSAPSSSYWAFVQRIEAPQNMGAGRGTYTLSFYAKAVSGSVAPGTFEIGIGAYRKPNPELTTSWRKVSVTIEADIPITSGYITAYIIRIGASISSIGVDIANVQLEVGKNATEFEHRSYGEELALCQRYFFVLDSGRILTTSNGNGIIAGNIYYPVTMRANPSITYYGGNSTSGNIIFFSAGSGTQLNYNVAANNLSTAYNSLNLLGFNSSNISIPNGYSAWSDLGTGTNQLKLTGSAEL